MPYKIILNIEISGFRISNTDINKYDFLFLVEFNDTFNTKNVIQRSVNKQLWHFLKCVQFVGKNILNLNFIIIFLDLMIDIHDTIKLHTFFRNKIYYYKNNKFFSHTLQDCPKLKSTGKGGVGYGKSAAISRASLGLTYSDNDRNSYHQKY